MDLVDGKLHPQLLDYYRFLLANADQFLVDPDRLISVAANLYKNSAVAEDTRKWISGAGKGLCWVEWNNRPMNRGEPLATLRSTDGPYIDDFDKVVVTGRDTHGERVCLVGVSSHGSQVASLYDTAEIRALASGGGSARLLAKSVIDFQSKNITLDQSPYTEDEGNPVVCCFSRRGDQIAVASRSIAIVDGNTLAIKKIGHDPQLPEGDVITAIAWTRHDGCIVTASDGQEAGRIVLWDTDSFSLLKVITTQYPRQPVATSNSIIGFWDEYRSMFVILDVDELAADTESGLFLQYIPSSPQTNPPPDCPSRFALAHRVPFALIASDDGKGYLLIDIKAKKPVAVLPVNVDVVRQIALSHDGSRVAIVQNDSKVVLIFGHVNPSLSNNDPEKEPVMGTFRHLGTVLNVDSSQSYDSLSISCHFSRSGNTILTDGKDDSICVWDLHELGDHSTLRFRSILPNLSQGLAPIYNSGYSPSGWTVTEGPLSVSITNACGRSKVATHKIGSDGSSNSISASTMIPRKDIIVGLATHPLRPLIATVTDQGRVCIIPADQIINESDSWVGALWSSAKALRRKEGDDKTFEFNVIYSGAQAGPTCIAFISNGRGLASSLPIGSHAADVISLVTGHEDGNIHFFFNFI